MSVELDVGLRKKLIDLLADVPGLRERTDRDAWLSRNLPREVEDQISRRDNKRRNDLTFIIDAVQNLQAKDGGWYILDLIDDVMNRLAGTRNVDEIKKVRDEIAKSLERLSEKLGEGTRLGSSTGETQRKRGKFAGEEPSPVYPQDGLPLPGDPKRWEWLKRLGFKRDPFRYTDGGTDPFLQEYFYFGMKHFYDILGDVSTPGTVFVFGPPGSGKSSLRNVIAQQCRKDDILPVIYHDFSSLVEKKEVQIRDHVEQILKTALGALTDLAEESGEEGISLPETEESEIICGQLWLYVSQYEDDPLRKQTLKKFLGPDPKAQEALPTDARELLGRFCWYVTKLFSYQFIYILIDPGDDIAWQVLEPLLSTCRSLKPLGKKDKWAFKLFLGQEVRARVLGIPWIEQEQSKRVYDLKWPEDELRALLETRLVECSGGRYRSFRELAEPEVEDLDGRVIQLSTGSPRKLIAICNRLFSEHSRKWSPDVGEPLLITAQEVREVLEPFEEQRPKSPLERLIAQGESERVEFKSTMRYNLKANRPDKEMEREIARTLCAFMNTEGGTLIIGVDDDGTILGLEKDFSTLGRRQNEDGFRQAFVNITENLFLSPLSPDDYTAGFEKLQNKSIYVVKIKRSKKPVFCLLGGVREFYVRKQTTTRKLDSKETLDYCMAHFYGSE